MTDEWSIGITVRICDCRSQDKSSTLLWTACKYFLCSIILDNHLDLKLAFGEKESQETVNL